MLTYVGPETKLGFGERESLNQVLVQERNAFEDRVKSIKREKSYEIETGFFKASGPVSNVKDTRVKIRDRWYTTIEFILDTKAFAHDTGDVFLGTVDKVGMNLGAIGYVLSARGDPLVFLKGVFGFVVRANGIVELIYKSEKDTDSLFHVVLSYWDDPSENEQ